MNPYSSSATHESDPERLRRDVEQLRLDARLPRENVSSCMKNLLDFCEKNASHDFLLGGAPPANLDGKNPFQEKKRCSLL